MLSVTKYVTIMARLCIIRKAAVSAISTMAKEILSAAISY